MSYTQHIHDCPLHAACHVIVCTDDSTGRAVWESHDTADSTPTTPTRTTGREHRHPGRGG